MTFATALTTAGRIGLLTVTCALWLALLAPIPAAADSTEYGGFDWYGSVYPMLAVDNADGAGGKLSAGAILSAGFRANRWLSVAVGGEWARRFPYHRGPGPCGDLAQVWAGLGQVPIRIAIARDFRFAVLGLQHGAAGFRNTQMGGVGRWWRRLTRAIAHHRARFGRRRVCARGGRGRSR